MVQALGSFEVVALVGDNAQLMERDCNTVFSANSLGKFKAPADPLSAVSILMGAAAVGESRHHAAQSGRNAEWIRNRKAQKGKSTQHAQVETDAEALSNRAMMADLLSSKLEIRIARALDRAECPLVGR